MDLYLVYIIIGVIVVGLVIVGVILDVDSFAGRLYRKIAAFMSAKDRDKKQ